MLSQDLEDGQSYITGFYNNEFYNDLGMNSEESVLLTNESLRQTGNYDKLVQRLKGEFWGIILRESIDENSDYYSGIINLDREIDLNSGVKAKITCIGIVNVNGEQIARLPVRVNVDAAEIKEIVRDPQKKPSNETVVTNGEDYPGPIPPQYDENYTEEDNFYDEETTIGAGEETEAEIEP